MIKIIPKCHTPDFILVRNGRKFAHCASDNDASTCGLGKGIALCLGNVETVALSVIDPTLGIKEL